MDYGTWPISSLAQRPLMSEQIPIPLSTPIFNGRGVFFVALFLSRTRNGHVEGVERTDTHSHILATFARRTAKSGLQSLLATIIRE